MDDRGWSQPEWKKRTSFLARWNQYITERPDARSVVPARIVAKAVDFAAIFLFAGIAGTQYVDHVVLANTSPLSRLALPGLDSESTAYYVVFLLTIFVATTGSEVLFGGSTGKLMLGIRAYSAAGVRLPKPRSLQRYVIRTAIIWLPIVVRMIVGELYESGFMSWSWQVWRIAMISATVVAAAYLAADLAFMVFRHDHRGITDRLTGTRVMSAPRRRRAIGPLPVKPDPRQGREQEPDSPARRPEGLRTDE